MKISSLSRTAVFVVAATSSALVYAQTDSSTDTTTSAPTKKEIRAQNHALEKSVRRSLVKTRNLDTSNIVVIARNGTVTLNGGVLDSAEIERAAAAARATPGVIHVNNEITIREPGN
jgi:osmotically-inducible protein OsmY